ncbi:MAG: MBL fold metallo-hydrolase [Proteobacteria bacterium]|nr:MBL fold metallo-hydrolase [Pseudomonadota bacterium]
MPSRNKRKNSIQFVMAIILTLATSQGRAQETTSPVESAETFAQLNIARETAGTHWQAAYDFLCAPAPSVGTPNQSPIVEPTQIFDNLFVIGRSGTVVYALQTSEGLILIDAGYRGQEESVLLPGLAALGLQPEDIKLVIVAHGHGDHYGGARYLQENYGARVALSAADWAVLDTARASEDGALTVPNEDMIVTEGESISLGNTEVLPVLIPGHTPGSIGLVFNVRDGDTKHTAALFGGTILIASRISSEGLQQYVDSVAHFSEITSNMGATVELQNHPIFDNMPAKLAALKTRQSNDEHPFVIGESAYQSYLGVIAECTNVELSRRGDL